MTRVQDPDYVGTSFRSPAVYADIVDLQQRQLVEEAMVQELGRLGVSGRASIQLIPPTREYEPEERLAALRDAGIDSLIVIAAESGMTRHYVPVTSSTTTTRGSLQLNVLTTTDGPTQYSRGDGTYEGTSQTRYQGGYSVQKPWAKGQFAVVELASGRIAWLGTSVTKGEVFANWDHVRGSACRAVARQMVGDRIFAAARSEPPRSNSPQAASQQQPPPSSAGASPAAEGDTGQFSCLPGLRVMGGAADESHVGCVLHPGADPDHPLGGMTEFTNPSGMYSVCNPISPRPPALLRGTVLYGRLSIGEGHVESVCNTAGPFASAPLCSAARRICREFGM